MQSAYSTTPDNKAVEIPFGSSNFVQFKRNPIKETFVSITLFDGI